MFKSTLLWIIGMLCVAYLFIRLVEFDPYPHIQTQYSLKDIAPQLQDGDLVLVSSVEDRYIDLGRYYWLAIVRYLFGKKEWNHVAMIVMINGKPYVYDTCPWDPRIVAYDFTANPHNESGFVSLSDYVANLNGYIGIRKLKPQFDECRARVLDTALHHNQHMSFKIYWWRWLKSLFAPDDINSTKYRYSCSEAAGSIYSDIGLTGRSASSDVNLSHFFGGMGFSSFLSDRSPFFEDIIHVTPGPQCLPRVARMFTK